MKNVYASLKDGALVSDLKVRLRELRARFGDETGVPVD